MRNRTWTWPVVMAAAGLAASSAGIDAQTDRSTGTENTAVPNASVPPEAGNQGAPVPPRAPQPPDEAEAKGPKLSTAEASMLRSRSARTLLRNGNDYIKYQQYEKALTYLREAERRQKELNAGEKATLRQAIETAQQGMRTPSLQTGYARTRKPQAGSIAIASRGNSASKADPAVARTEAARPAQASSAETAAAPGLEHMRAEPKGDARVHSLDPLSPEVLAKDLPSAADLAESKSTRTALKEYEAAGLPTNEPRQPLELPKPLNEKIGSLEETESQYQASESRPDPSPEAIAASLSAMRRQGTPEPLPGSPARTNQVEEALTPLPKIDTAPTRLTEDTPTADHPAKNEPLTEPAPEPAAERPAKNEPLTEPAPEPAESALPKFDPPVDPPAVPVVATPDLPPLEPGDSPKAAVTEPSQSVKVPNEPEAMPETDRTELPKLPEPRTVPAEMPPLPLASEEPQARKDVAANEKASSNTQRPVEMPAEAHEELKEPALPELPRPIANETLRAAETAPSEKPSAAKMEPERDSNLSKVQDLTAPPAVVTEPVAETPEPQPRKDAVKPVSGIKPEVIPTAESADEPGLPPLPASSEPGIRSLPDSLPPLPVQPIAEAADDSSDLPPLPDRPVSLEPAARNGLPPLPAATIDTPNPAVTEPAETAEPARAELPPLPVANEEKEALPPLPTATATEAKVGDATLPPLPTATAETPKATESAETTEPARAELPPLPDSPPAPTPTNATDDSLPKLPEQPERVAQATPDEARTPVSAASDTLPPLPAEEIAGTPRAAAPATEAASESSSFSRRYLSGLNDRQRREIEELARMQQERTGGTTPGLSPLDAPARAAGDSPRVPLPAGNTSMFGAIDDPLVRLELPRAPSPAEARPIRAILLPEQFETIKPREFEPRRKMWASAATAHYPLYFQDPSLERYGISVEQRLGRGGRKLTYPIDDPKESKLRNQIATPFFSSGLFALQIATWPFRAIADPPWESTYDLGYYRPGDIVPEDTVVIPWKGVGPLFRGNGY